MKSFLHIVLLVLCTACSTSTTKEKPQKASSLEIGEQVTEVSFQVIGMTCGNCENTVQKGVSSLPGVISVEANFKDSTAIVQFDATQTSSQEIIDMIKQRGYQVNENKNK